MENQNTPQEKQRPLKLLIRDNDVQERFQRMLGKNATPFLMSVLNVASNDKLAEAEPQSVLMAAAVAATLNLPIDPNLGMAYLVPFKDKNRGNKTFAQFQLGYKGFVELLHRTGRLNRINVDAVYEGEIVSIDRMTGDMVFNWIQDNDERAKKKQIGVMAWFRLDHDRGFEKSFFMSNAELEKHAKRYSQSYKAGFGVWKDDRLSMEKKTVLKLLLMKYAPKSVEMQTALRTDQALIGDYDGQKLNYPDNEPMDVEELKAQQNANKVKRINELLVEKLDL